MDRRGAGISLRVGVFNWVPAGKLLDIVDNTLNTRCPLIFPY